MRILNKKKNLVLSSFCLLGVMQISAQDSSNYDIANAFTTIELEIPSDPTTTILQDPRIDQLLAIKTAMDKDGTLSSNYRIQLYNGNMNEAQKVLKKAELLFPQWKTDIKWETPEFKVRIGNYRSKLERDRALREIKKEFSGAFSPKPKNN